MATFQFLDPLVDSIKARLPQSSELQTLPWATLLMKYSNVVVCAVLVVVGIFQTKRNYDKVQKAQRAAIPAPGFPIISEKEKFKWKIAEPSKPPSFKSKYHMTMADASTLEDLDPNDLLLMDKTYRSRIEQRRLILKQNPDTVVGANNDPRAHEAVSELYSFIIGNYLPLRYPDMFRCHHTEFEGGQQSMLQNLITGELVPTRGSAPPLGNTPTRLLLSNLAKHLDEDFLILMPAKYEKPGNAKYILEAYETCCPFGGFDPKERLGKVVNNIRGPVAGHGGKLEASMERFWNKLAVGKYVERVVWSVAMNEDLFAPGLGVNSGKMGGQFTGELNPKETFIRCERQTLHRMPTSKAIVFAYKTYMYPLQQIKEEEEKGMAGQLIQAIDDLKDGLLPETQFYEGGAEWAKAVKEYLRR